MKRQRQIGNGLLFARHKEHVHLARGWIFRAKLRHMRQKVVRGVAHCRYNNNEAVARVLARLDFARHVFDSVQSGDCGAAILLNQKCHVRFS